MIWKTRIFRAWSKVLVWACDNFFLHLEDPSFQGMNYPLFAGRPNFRHAFIFYDMEDPDFRAWSEHLIWACDDFSLHLEDPSFQGMDYPLFELEDPISGMHLFEKSRFFRAWTVSVRVSRQCSLAL